MKALKDYSHIKGFNYTASYALNDMNFWSNLLEGGQYVPMRIPPTAKIAAYRRQENPNIEEIRRWVYTLMGILKEACYITGSNSSDVRL